MKKAVSIFLTMALTLVLLAGCSSGSAGSSAGSAPASSGGNRQPITMWFWGATDAQQKALNTNLSDAYNASQNQYQLTIEYRASVDDDTGVALSGGSGPDIVYTSGPAYAANYAGAGKLLSLDKYSKQYGWKESVLSPLYQACTVGGALYSIPNSVNTVGLFYSKSVLKQNGWSVPKTVDDLVKIMNEAQQKGLYGALAGNKGWRPDNEYVTTIFLNEYAGSNAVYNCLTGKQSWNSDAVAKAVQESADWYQKGYLGGKDYTSLEVGNMFTMLATGKSPFVITAAQFYQFATDYFNDENGNADDLGFVAFPPLKAGDSVTYPVGTPAAFGINAKTKYPDECAKILNMMLQPQFMQAMTKDWPGYWGTPLKTLDVDTSSMNAVSKSYVDAYKSIVDAINKGNFGYFQDTFFPSATSNAFVNIDTVWEKTATVSDFLKSVDAAYKTDQGNHSIPPIPSPGK